MAQIDKENLSILTNRQGGNGNGGIQTPLVDYSPPVRVISQGRALSAQSMMTSIGRFDPDRITMKQRRQMAADPMIALALNFLRVLLIGADYHFESTDPQLVAFTDNCYRRIHAALISELMQALPYGYAGIVKRFQLESPDWQYEDDKGQMKQVWPSKNVQAVTWNAFTNLPPEGLKPVFQADGKTFNGMVQEMLKQNPSDPGPLTVPVTHSLWYTHGKESVFGDWYGVPRTRASFRYWWSYWYQWLLADRHAETDADPPLVVGVPEGEMVPDPDNPGSEITSQELGMRIGQYLRDGATIVLPTDTYEDAEGKPTGTRKWTADFLRGGENLQAFRANFEYMDVMKIRGTLVPESALVAGGGRNTMLVAVQSLEKSLEQLSDEIDQLVNDYLIPDLLAQNFVKPASVRKITTGFREEDLTLPKQLLTILAQANPGSLDLDVRKLAHQVNLPLKPAGEGDAQNPSGNLPALPGQATPNADQGGAPGGNNNPAGGFRGPGGQTAQTEARANALGGGGGNRNATSIGGQPVAGISGGGALRIDGQPFSFGFSLDGEDHEPDPAAAALPDTPHFADPKIRSAATGLLGVLDGWFSDLYGEAADAVEEHMSLAAHQALYGDLLALAGGGWNPDLHPRWPKGHGDLSGEFMEVGHFIDSLANGGQADLSNLAQGSRQIQKITADAPDQNTLRLHVQMTSGAHVIEAPRGVSFSHIMGALKALDRGEGAGENAAGLRGQAQGPLTRAQHEANQAGNLAPQSYTGFGSIHVLADSLRAKAEEEEPPISKDLQALAKSNHGTLQSFDKRFKENPTIAEKLERKAEQYTKRDSQTSGKVWTPEDYAPLMADNLRYTMTTDTKTHAQDVQKILDDLRSKGYEIPDHLVENSWDRLDYKGININVKSPSGYTFELQFHTKESLAAKREAHGLYEKARLKTTPEDQKKALKVQMNKIWRSVPEPPGIQKVGTLMGERGEGTPDTRSAEQKAADAQLLRDVGGGAGGGGPPKLPNAPPGAPDQRGTVQRAADRQLQQDTAPGAGGANPPAGAAADEKPPLVQLPEPPKLEWREPPKPKGQKGQQTPGGFTAFGKTNTSIGDLAEKAVRELGLRSLLPPGRRQNPLDAAFGDYGFEIKAVTTYATEYKAKPSKAAIAEKLAYAKANNLKPGLMIVVYDPDAGEFHAYWTDGIASLRLNQNRFHYMGTVSEKGLEK